MYIYCSLCGNKTNVPCAYCGNNDKSKVTSLMIDKLLELEMFFRFMHDARFEGRVPEIGLWIRSEKILEELFDLRMKEKK